MHAAATIRAWKLRFDEDEYAVVTLPARLDERLPQLTAAERDVVTHVLAGASNREIAERRRTAIRTVANQLAAIFQKLGVTSRAELVVRVTQLTMEEMAKNRLLQK